MVDQAAEFTAVFEHFDAQDIPGESCYPWAPVFPCRIGDIRVVVKRTRSQRQAAAAIAGWTSGLARAGVRVVKPVQLRVDNPVAIGDHHWVAYPFIDGTVYTGELAQAESAGSLLGRIHATSCEVEPPPFEWPDHDEESVREDREGIEKVLSGPVPDAAARLVRLVEDFMPRVLPAIRAARLPMVGAVMDYKANNLVYTADGPVLVDPDNADRAPRLLDLALAAMQFHIEHDAAPARMFNASEWEAFIGGYARWVELTDVERDLWPVAVDYMLSEYGVWSLIESDQWDDPHERALQIDLARASADRFPLP